MTNYNTELLKEAHKYSIYNYTSVRNSPICGCFYCQSTFEPKDIEEWTDTDSHMEPTALCPNCGIDAVIGSVTGFKVSDPNFLKEMNYCWFCSSK